MNDKNIEVRKIQIELKEQLDKLYKESALTFTGVEDSEESIRDIIKWINEFTEVANPLNINVIKGITMNEKYGLTQNNAYPDNLTFICINLQDIKEVSKIALPRFSVGGRWFNDIVDNNRIKQNEIDGIDEEEMY